MRHTSAISSSSRLLPWLAFGLPPLLWAGNFIVGRVVQDDIPPMSLSFARWAIAFILMLPFAFNAIRTDWRQYWQHRWAIIGTSVFGVAAYNSLLYISLHTTTASNALMLNSLAPLLIGILGAVFYREKMSRFQLAGVCMSFAGVLVLVLQGNVANLRGLTFVPGDLVVLLAALCFAIYAVWLRVLPKSIDRVGLMSAQVGVALVLLFPFAAAEYLYGQRPTWSGSVVGAMIYVGLFASAVAYALFMKAVEHFGPIRAGLCVHLAPMFGVFLSWVFLGERLHLFHGIGISAIALGVASTTIEQKR